MKTIIALLIACLPAFGQDWQFDKPTATTGCNVVLGQYAEGWVNSALGKQGMWNLGSGGGIAARVNVTANATVQTASDTAATNAPAPPLMTIVVQVPSDHIWLSPDGFTWKQLKATQWAGGIIGIKTESTNQMIFLYCTNAMRVTACPCDTVIERLQ